VNTGSSDLCVCITACGSPRYMEVAGLAVVSVLQNSDFEIFVGSDRSECPAWAVDPRVHFETFRQEAAGDSPLFLRKFDTLEAALSKTNASLYIQLDADAMFIVPVRADEVATEIGDSDFAMVEQHTISGSNLGRRFFLDHYVGHTLKWFNHSGGAPAESDFRYYNSGLVMARRDPLKGFLRWAIEARSTRPAHHTVGSHMIGDQDYFQYWTNSLHPGRCRDLDWYWNHCEHWDEHFPSTGAKVLHFSNFCRGPDEATVERMRTGLRA